MSDSDEESEIKCSSRSSTPVSPRHLSKESPLSIASRRHSPPSPPPLKLSPRSCSPPSPRPKGVVGKTAESDSDGDDFPRLGFATIELLSLRAWEWTKLDSKKGSSPKEKKEPPTNTEKLFADLRAILFDPFSEKRSDAEEGDYTSPSDEVVDEAKTPIEDLPATPPPVHKGPSIPSIHEGYEKLKVFNKEMLGPHEQVQNPAGFGDSSPEGKTIEPEILPKRFEKCYEVFLSKLDSTGRLVLRERDMAEPGRWKALGFFLASRPHIKGLRLQGMEISKTEATQLGKGALKHLRHITFCENNLGLNKDALEIIVGMLLICDYLEAAAFNRNNLTDVHIVPLLRLIESHSLSKLSLSWNGIQDAGAMCLAQHLRQISDTTRLRGLDLSYNFIGANGVTALQESSNVLRSRGFPFELNYRNNCKSNSPSYSYSRPLSSLSNPVRNFLGFMGSSRATSNPIAIPRTMKPLSAPSSFAGTPPSIPPPPFRSWRTPHRRPKPPPVDIPTSFSLYSPAELPM